MVVLHYRKEGAILKKNLGTSGLSWYNMERCQGSKQGQARKKKKEGILDIDPEYKIVIWKHL